jgi:hypothetical protein
MMANTKRTSHSIAAIVAAIALMAPIRAQEPAQRGPSDGIKVHGHWAITIRNPDGTVASRTEIENALMNAGAQALVDFLSRRATAGHWFVRIVAGDTGSIGLEEGSSLPSHNLTLSQVVGPAVQLTGSPSWTHPAPITRIESYLMLCDGAGGNCQQVLFSAKDITPIPVALNQIVQFTVTFTFS